MDGLLTQEEINQLLSSIVDEIENERVCEKKTSFHRKDTFDATIKALKGKTNKDDAINIMYAPEHTDIVNCPTCRKEFNICAAYNEDGRCPNCGQHFSINLWIS